MKSTSYIKSVLIAVSFLATVLHSQDLEDFVGNWSGVETLESPTINYSDKSMNLIVDEGGDREGFLIYTSNCEFIYNPEVSWANHYIGLDKIENKLLLLRRLDTPIGVVYDELLYDINHWDATTIVATYQSESGDTYHQISLNLQVLGLDNQLPKKMSLHQNYPNPFNPITTITLESVKDAVGSLLIYNLNGQLVKTLHQGEFQTGLNSFQWNGENQNGISVSGGTYIYRLLIDGNTQSHKMVLLK